MEAIGLMLMAFLRGNLPWDAVRDYKKPAHLSQAVKMKENLDFNVSRYSITISFLHLLSLVFIPAMTGILQRIRKANG